MKGFYRKVTRRFVYLPLLTVATPIVFSITPDNCTINQRVLGPDKATIVNISKPVNKKTVFFRTISFNFGVTQSSGEPYAASISSSITQSAGSPTLSQTHNLGTIDSATHATGSSSPTLASSFTVAPDGAAHAQSSGLPTLEQTH